MTLAALLAGPAAALGQSQAYKAQHFDADVQVLPGGRLRVHETIAFEFQQGTFTRVWRDIPTRKTDGIRIVEATMDGRPLPQDDGPAHVRVTGRTTVRVEWSFEPTARSVHTFGLTYDAMGVGRTEGGRDIVEWQALPSEHRYAIDESSVVVHAPEPPADAPALETRRVRTSKIVLEGGAITASATGIEPNGWMSVGLRFPAGSLVQAQPGWKTRQDTQSAGAPRWELAAAAVFVGGLILLLLARAGYRPPAPATESTETAPPENLQPAVAAALLARGDTRRAGAMATLLDLAERGVLSVSELSHRLGVRSFALAQVPGSHDLAAHEETALRLAFSDRDDEVTLSKARARLARGGRRFSASLAADMAARGLVDPERAAARHRMTMVGAALVVLGVFGSLAMIPLIKTYGAWPMLIGMALSVNGVIGLIVAAATSVLTDEGARQAARWRGFRRHLKTVAASHDPATPPAPPAWGVYAAALGLGYYWARYLKRHPGAIPAWFTAMDPAHTDAAYVAFMSSAGAHGGGAAGGAGGSGAAGGGGSGAA